jgi:hypothetical protein
MIQINVFPILGFIAGVHYTNEDREGLPMEDDLAHTVQVFLFLIVLNITWFTVRNLNTTK